jgi:hypothetical protein
MLHAWRLAFRHPISDAWLEFTAPPPQDFLATADVPDPGKFPWSPVAQ